jgi:putative transposase
MCRVLKVHRSGFYAWLLDPLSPRAKGNEALTAKNKDYYDQSMGIYGSPRIFCDWGDFSFFRYSNGQPKHSS